MYNVEGLAQMVAVDNKRYVGFKTSLCSCYKVNTVSAECVEQLSCDAWVMTHIFTYNRDSGKIFL